jgi:hypothetical protein
MTRIGMLLGLSLLLAMPARADHTGRDAGKHFQRGVDLYNDGDFRGALVEFKRAYALLPRASVLYDIGETQFQLQDYASALTTMRRFLAETSPAAAHRAEVEATVETLIGRVGKIALTADVVQCDVSVDDQPAGTTPLGDSILVSIGPRRVSVSCPNRPVATRRVEVAAGELVHVDVLIGPALTTPRLPTPARPAPELLQSRRRSMLALTWAATSILAATTLGVGAAALVESSQLGGLRNTYPASTSDIGRKASLTRGLAIAADTFGVATLVGLGVSTYVTVRYHKERKLVLGFGLGPTSTHLTGTF